MFWLLDGQAEEGGRKDELACPARCQTNLGASACPRPQRRPATDEPSVARSERFRSQAR